MAAQVDFANRSKPTQANLLITPEDKSRFGQIHFGGHRLHPRFRRFIGQQTNGGWVSPKKFRGKSIDNKQRNHRGNSWQDKYLERIQKLGSFTGFSQVAEF